MGKMTINDQQYGEFIQKTVQDMMLMQALSYKKLDCDGTITFYEYIMHSTAYFLAKVFSQSATCLEGEIDLSKDEIIKEVKNDLFEQMEKILPQLIKTEDIH